MASARFWKKWLRLGEWWLRRRIKSVSPQPIVFRQPRLRALLPNDTTLVPCAAAKRALVHLVRGALATSTLERSADTVPILARRNASPALTERESAIGVPFLWRILVAKLTTMRRSVRMEVSKQKRPPTETASKGTADTRPVLSIPRRRDNRMLIPNCASPEARRWRSVEFIFRLSEIDHGGGALKRMNPNR